MLCAVKLVCVSSPLWEITPKRLQLDLVLPFVLFMSIKQIMVEEICFEKTGVKHISKQKMVRGRRFPQVFHFFPCGALCREMLLDSINTALLIYRTLVWNSLIQESQGNAGFPGEKKAIK